MMREDYGLAVVITVLGVLSGCNESERDRIEATEQAILFGDLDSGDPGVVGLSVGGSVYCTGTLIAPRIIVTAAHCISDFAPDEVFFGSRTDIGGSLVRVSKRRAHPEYIPATGSKPSINDIGAVELETEAPDTARESSVLTSQESSALAPGTTIRIVGFGGVAPTLGPVAIKRTGTTEIDSVADSTFTFHANPARTCSGDSGGPAFMTIDGEERLVGITAGGDEDCAEYAVDTRVDVYVDDFLSSLAGPTARLGERCRYANNCLSGLCVPSETRSAFAYCSTPCQTDRDCSRGLSCHRDADGSRLCRLSSPGPGEFGATCTVDEDCFSRICAQRIAGENSVCSLRCSDEDTVACPPEFACEQSASFDGGACFVENVKGDGGALVPSSAAGGTCTALRASGQALNRPWLAIAAALAAASYARRHSRKPRR